MAAGIADIQDIIHLSRRGMRAVAEAQREPAAVDRKADGSLVTAADIHSNQVFEAGPLSPSARRISGNWL